MRVCVCACVRVCVCACVRVCVHVTCVSGVRALEDTHTHAAIVNSTEDARTDGPGVLSMKRCQVNDNDEYELTKVKNAQREYGLRYNSLPPLNNNYYRATNM